MRVRADSVEETTLSHPGTGDIVLAGATAGNRPFSVIGDGNECYYRAETADLSAWEIGSATYHSGTNLLVRDVVYTNSLGTTALVDLTGVCTVFLTLLSREINAAGSTGDIQINSSGAFGALTPGTGVSTFLATPTSANLRGALTDETGTGAAVFATSPTLVTPALGTPSSVTLTNATGLPVGTGISGLGSGVATFLATPSSANLRGALTDETGTGAAVFATSPTLVTPDLGTPSAVTLTNGTGLPVGTGISGLGTGVATFLGTPSSANLRAALTDETGTGAAVFATSPVLVTPNLGTPSAIDLTNATNVPSSVTPAGSSGDIQTNNGSGGLGVITPASGIATFLATPSSANLRAALTDETGTGAAVFATSPALVTPDLGTPSAATLTNATGLPVSTGISGLGTAVATFLAVPSSTNLRAALTDEVGTGAAYFVGGALGTPSSGDASNLTSLPISTGVSGLGTGVATFLVTPSSANLRAALTDETGTGIAYFVGGALGTPASGNGSNLTNIRTAAKAQAQWVSGAIVANTTVWLIYKTPYAGTVNSLDYFTGNGSFTVAVKINGTNITGLSAVTVNSGTPANTSASAANTFSAGDSITAVVTGSTSTPTDALLNLNITWSN